ncbi:hypothetical protein SCHPADRAFT_896091 [Schizopora paradoxa]|uniref:Uncharacterized protein n=1 Tax=Schizopora paradoxa TaxID=27342 RepID=A0A0H2R7Z7_9AGAM|nr:hypothetical protein SCHPADRAFT_896091 [Schizopora paradoxa]
MSSNSSEFHMNNLTIVVTCDTELQARPLKLVINVTNPVTPFEEANIPPHAAIHPISSNVPFTSNHPASTHANIPAVDLDPLMAAAPLTPRETQTGGIDELQVDGSPAATISSVTESYTSPQSNPGSAGDCLNPSPAATVSSITESYTSPQNGSKESTPHPEDARFETPNNHGPGALTQLEEIDTQMIRSIMRRDPEGFREIVELNISPIQYLGETPANDEETIPDSLQSTRAWTLNLRSPGSEQIADVSLASTRRAPEYNRARPTNYDDDLAEQHAPPSSKRRRVDPDESPTQRLGAHHRDSILPNPTSRNTSSNAVAGPANAHRTLRYVSLEPVPLASGNEVRPEWRVEAEEINRRGRAAFEEKLKKPYPN